MKFHEKYGFKIANVFENVVYKHNKWFDVVWMNKTINEFKGAPKEPIAIGDMDKNLIRDILNKNEDIIKG